MYTSNWYRGLMLLCICVQKYLLGLYSMLFLIMDVTAYLVYLDVYNFLINFLDGIE